MSRGKNIGEANIMTGIFKEMLLIQVMAVITATIGSVVDGVIISNFLGREAMAAFSIASPFFIVLACVSNLVGSGAQSLSARYLGKGDRDKVNAVFSLTIVTVTVIGLVLLLVSFILSNQIATLLGANEETLPQVSAYIKGLSFGALPIVLNGPVMQFLQLDKAQNFSFMGVLLMTCADIAGDLLNVFVFKQGMLGMALATSIGYYASVLLLATHFLSRKGDLRFSIRSICTKELKDIFLIGLPTAVSQICLALRSLCLNNILLGIAGTVFVAAYAGQNTMSSLLSSVGIGFGMTTLMICSVLVGEEDRTSLKKTMKDALIISVAINTVIAVVVFAGADYLAQLFSKGDLETRTVTARILRLYALSLPINIININLQNFFQSTKKILLVNLICILNNFALDVAFALILPGIWGKDAIWYMFPMSQLLTLIIIVIASCIHNHGIPRSFDEFLMIGDGFGVSEDDCLDFEIGSMNDVMDASIRTGEFCRNHNIDRKKTYISSLAIEEMTGNIVNHGFEANKKNIAEIRIAIKDDRLIIRMRDNCRNFNPVDHLNNADNSDITRNVGIRMITGMADNFKYQSTFRLNVLVMEIGI